MNFSGTRVIVCIFSFNTIKSDDAEDTFTRNIWREETFLLAPSCLCSALQTRGWEVSFFDTFPAGKREAKRSIWFSPMLQIQHSILWHHTVKSISSKTPLNLGFSEVVGALKSPRIPVGKWWILSPEHFLITGFAVITGTFDNITSSYYRIHFNYKLFLSWC